MASQQLAIRPSFLCLVLAPYLRRKVETVFQKCREDQADGVQPSHPVLASLRSIFLSFYPSFHFLAEAVDIGKHVQHVCVHHQPVHIRALAQLLLAEE